MLVILTLWEAEAEGTKDETQPEQFPVKPVSKIKNGGSTSGGGMIKACYMHV